MKKFKQLSAFFLVLAMVLSLIPALGYIHANAATPGSLEEGANVVIAKEEASGVWSQSFYNDNKAGEVAAFWNARGIYLMYPEQATKAVTVNGEALTANQDSTNRDFVILEFSKFGIEMTDYNLDFYVEITGAYEWSGWVLLRKDVTVRDTTANITTSTSSLYTTKADGYVIPENADHVIDVTLNITSMPAYGSWPAKNDPWMASVLTSTAENNKMTGIGIVFSDQYHVSSSNCSSYHLLLLKNPADNELYVSIQTPDQNSKSIPAYPLGIYITGETTETLKIRWETERQADGKDTSYLYINGKFIFSRENTRITGNGTFGSGHNQTIFVKGVNNRPYEGDTQTFNYSGTINKRYYAASFDPAEATLDYLTADMLLGENTSADAVSSNLTLPECYGNLNGVKLVWTATGAVDENGVVDTTVDGAAATLTATIEGTSISKSFNFTNCFGETPV